MTDLPESSSEKNEQTNDSLEHIVPVSNKVEPLTIRKVVPSDQVETLHKELQLLRTKCSYYESALEKVLMFIVPANCRGMVEQALKIGKSNFEKH